MPKDIITMASISPFTTTTPNSSIAPLKQQLLPKTTQVFVLKSQTRQYEAKTSCNVTNKTEPKPTGVARFTKRITATIEPQRVAFPKPLHSAIRTLVRRPEKSRTMKEKEEEEVVVVDVEFHANEFVQIDVYVKDDHHQQPNVERHIEFAGSFLHLPHTANGRHDHGDNSCQFKTSKKFALNGIIKDLAAEDDDDLEVVLVPRSRNKSIVITDVRIK